MYVCVCNNFNDKALTKAIDARGPTTIISEKSWKAIYRECAGGKNPVCGTCTGSIKEKIGEHNKAAESLLKLEDTLSPKASPTDLTPV